MKTFMLSSAALLLSTAAMATESYLLSGSSSEALTDATCWDNAEGFPDANVDYVSKITRIIQTPRYTDLDFTGRSLQLLGDGEKKSANLGFRATSVDHALNFTGDGGLVLGNVYLDCWTGYCTTIGGNVTVVSSEKAPVRLYSRNSIAGTKDANIEFAGDYDFAGAANTYCRAYIKQNATENGASTRMVLRILTDTSKYYGHLCVSAYGDLSVPEAEKWTVIQLGTHDFNGTVDLRESSMLEAYSLDESVLNIANLTAAGNTALSLRYDQANSKGVTYKITGSLTITDPVAIKFSTLDTRDTTTGFTHALLKAPAGVTLNADDWYVAKSVTTPYITLSVSTDETDGLSTLWATVRPVITMQASDQSKVSCSYAYESSAPANNWSDGNTPSADKDYLMQRYTLRTISGTFAGHTLTLSPESKSYYPTVALRSSIDVDDLRVDLSKNSTVVDNYGSTYTISGNIYLSPASSYYLRFDVRAGSRSTIINSNLSGDGMLAILIKDGAGQGYVQLGGDNSDWTGRLRMYRDADASGQGIVRFEQAENLGGAMSAFTYNALELCDLAVLTPMTTGVILDATNRGIYAPEGSAVKVAEGLVFGIKERMTYAGKFTKLGAGRLQLGGAAPLFTTDQFEAPVEVEDAETNVLYIAEGSLTPLSDTAFQGLDVRFASGTEIVLEHPSALSADAARYGMKLTADLASLMIADATIPVSLASTTSTKCGLSAICTLPAAQTDAFMDKFVLKSATPYGDDRRATLVTIDNGDDTVTFAVQLARGLTVLVK